VYGFIGAPPIRISQSAFSHSVINNPSYPHQKKQAARGYWHPYNREPEFASTLSKSDVRPDVIPQTIQSARLVQSQSDMDLLEPFVRWAAAQLNLDLTERPDGACELVHRTETPDGPTTECISVFCWSRSNVPREVDGRLVTPVTSGGPLFEWLRDALQAQGPAVHARPKFQPSGVHDFFKPTFCGIYGRKWKCPPRRVPVRGSPIPAIDVSFPNF